MKAALVLSADSPLLQQQFHEINAVFKQMAIPVNRIELWIFYQDCQPEVFPEMSGVSSLKLIRVEHAHLPESYLQLLEHLMGQDPMDLLLFASDRLGEELATRLSYRLNGSSCLKVEACHLKQTLVEVEKSVYGNHLLARFVLRSAPYCISVAKKAYGTVNMVPYERLKQQTIIIHQVQPHWIKEHLVILDQPETGLTDADLVLVVGQGAENRETVNVIKGIADTIGAQMGASRPVVMNAWIDYHRLIGASGLIISPKICIAAGVSGTGVFSVGIKNSQFIVAINHDDQAPIFHMADVGIVGDLTTILLELERVILGERAKPNLPQD